jgi:hypothetical protein
MRSPSGTPRPAASPDAAARSARTGRPTAASDRINENPPASITSRGPNRYAVSPGTCSTAPSLTSVASNRAAVDFGRAARSATSVTPSGLSSSASSTAKARLMDWTLDIGTFVF